MSAETIALILTIILFASALWAASMGLKHSSEGMWVMTVAFMLFAFCFAIAAFSEAHHGQPQVQAKVRK